MRSSVYSKLFWNEWEMNPESGEEYNIGFVYDIYGELDKDRLCRALELYIEASPWLRLRFYTDSENVLNQEICNCVDDGIIYQDISNSVQSAQVLSSLIKDYTSLSFNLAKSPLFRFILLKYTETHHILLLRFHHIIIDGVNAWQAPERISYYYERPEEIVEVSDKNSEFQQEYHRYLKEEDKECEQIDREAGFKYLSDHVKGKDLCIKLPRFACTEDEYSIGDNVIAFSLGSKLHLRIMEYVSRYNLTIYQFLFACWSILLHKYSGQYDFVITYPVNMRGRKFRRLNGAYINTLPMGVSISGDSTFREVADCIKNSRKQVKPFQRILINDIVSELRKESVIKGKDKFWNVSFAEQKENFSAPLRLGNLKTEARFSQSAGRDELLLTYKKCIHDIQFQLVFNKKYFPERFIQLMSGHLIRIIEKCVRKPDEKLGLINLLTYDEKKLILDQWSRAKVKYPKNKTIVELFEKQVTSTPDKDAAVYGDKTISYRELNRKANCLAHTIRKKMMCGIDLPYGMDRVNGFTKDGRRQLVGIYLERGIDMIIAILGIIKSGSAYVPFDLSDPEERLKYKVNDSEAHIIVSKGEMAAQIEKLAEYKPVVLDILCNTGIYSDSPGHNPVKVNSIDDMAYMIYTSGSTGRPKGVCCTHHNLVNFVYSYNGAFPVESSTNSLALTNICFDVSVEEIFTSILNGNTLHIIDRDTVIDSENFIDYIFKNKIGNLYIPPFLVRAFYKFISDSSDDLTFFKRILFGVEPIPEKILSEIKQKLPDCFIVNGYGPTETTICSTMCEVSEKYRKRNAPIGKPIGNTVCYVLDDCLNPQPIGIPGELYIGGEGVSIGYWHKNELSTQRFIKDPFARLFGRKSGKLYRTGDNVRWLPDGNLEFVGRNDSQLKIRGFRIEIGEIEKAFGNIPSIVRSVVIVNEDDNDKKLIAFYTSNGAEIKESFLRKELRKYLPEYMIPAYLIRINDIPVTPNGKVDKNKLKSYSYMMKSYPDEELSEDERKLNNIWSDVLHHSDINLDDSFFNIGGHSLLAGNLVHRINDEFNSSFNVAWVFEYDTVRRQGEAIGNNSGQNICNLQLKDAVNIIQKDVKMGEKLIPNWQKKYIFLTGATGFLGSHILKELIEKTEAVIFCLVRSNELQTSDSSQLYDKLNRWLEFYKIDIDHENAERIFVIGGDLGRKNLGINSTDYKFLIDNIDEIFHCGAVANHIMPYSALRDVNTMSVLELINIAFSGRRKKMHFISSVSGISEKDSNGIGVEYISDIEMNGKSSGYGISKWVAEQIMCQAFERGLKGSVLRPGYILGNTQTGATNLKERNNLILLLNSIKHFSCAPALKMTFNAVPVDYLAKAIVEISGDKDAYGTSVNLTNPHEISFTELVDVLGKTMKQEIKVVPYREWYDSRISVLSDNDPFAPLKTLYGNSEGEFISKFATEKAQAFMRKKGLSFPDDYSEMLRTSLVGV